MMHQEFLSLTGRKVSYETYTNKIEQLYMDSPLTKQEFCKQYVEQTKRTKQAEGNNCKIELQRSNVTLSAFLSYCRAACKKNGIYFGIEDTKEFENPSYPCNTMYFVRDGKKIVYNDNYKTEWDASEAPCQSEIYRVKPLDYQSYVLNFDGSVFNEICEFTFWDDKTGNGYYYQVNKEAN